MKNKSMGCLTPILIFVIIGIGGTLLSSFIYDNASLIPDYSLRTRIGFGIGAVSAWGGIILAIAAYIRGLNK